MKALIVCKTKADFDRITGALHLVMVQKPLHCASMDSFKKAISKDQFDVVISDSHVDEYSALQFLAIFRTRPAFAPFIIVAGEFSDAEVVSLLQAGVTDYVSKDNLARLTIAIDRAMRECHKSAELHKLVAELRQRELRLVQRQEQYKLVVETQSEMIIRWDISGKVLFANQSFLGYHEMTLEDFAGISYYNFVNDHDRFTKKIALLSQSNPEITDVHTRIGKKHGQVWHEWTDRAFFNAAGEITEIQSIGRDITLQKNAEHQIRESEEFNQGVLSALQASIAVIDKHGLVIATNETWKAFDLRENVLVTGVHVKSNYFEACTRIKQGDETGTQISHGIRQVLEKKIPSFHLEYSSGSKWFLVRVTPFSTNLDGAVISHVESSDKKQHDLDLEAAYKKTLKNEEKFKTISNYTANWETWIGTNGRPTWMNPGVIDLIGYSAEEMLAMPDFYATMVYPEDLPRVRQKLARSLAQKTAGDHFECRGNHKNGSHPWFSISWRQVYDVDDNWLGIRTSALDITEKKKYEQELLNRENLLNETQRIARLGSWTWNTTSGEITMSRQMLATLEIDDATKYPLLDDVMMLVHPDSIDQVKKMLGNAQENFNAGEFEIRIQTARGKEKYLLARVSDQPFSASNTGNVYGTALDITELKQSHELRAKSEFRFKKIFESISDVYYQTTLDGTITMVSPSSIQLLGYTPEEMMTKPVSVFYADPKIRQLHIAKLESEGDSVEFEAMLVAKDGSQVIASINLSSAFIDNTWILHGLIRNITERKRQEIRLESQRLKLMEAHRLNTRIIETSDRFFYVQSAAEDGGSHRLKFISRQVIKITGVRDEEIKAQPGGWIKLIHEDDLAHLRDVMISLFRYKQPVEMQYRVFNRNLDRYVWVEDYCCPFVDEYGQVVELYGSVKDITERKLANEKIENERKQSLALQFQLLSSQLNPDFIYNTLNSFQYYILNGLIEQSLNHIADFSQLLRKVLENSMYQFITIEDEIYFLKQYILIPQQRMKSELSFRIEVDPEIEVSEHYIPPMILQPYIENCIMHGFADSPRRPELKVTFKRIENRICCSIEDNGIGRAASKKHRGRNNSPGRQSFAIGINQKRINLLNQVTDNNFKVEVLDLVDGDGNVSGTRVVLSYTQPHQVPENQ